MENVAEWAVLLSIKKEHAANVYAGTKTVELRKSVPNFNPNDYDPAKYPIRVYLYETRGSGGPGRITGFFDCPSFLGIKLQSETKRIPQGLVEDAQVSEEYIREYAGDSWIYAWDVKNANRLTAPVALEELGMDRPPQSWQYLGELACTILKMETPRSLWL